MRFRAAAALVLTLAAACRGEDARSTGKSGSPGFRMAVVTSAGQGDSFWDVVKTGAEQAGSDLGVEVSYQGSSDPQRQAQLIDAAVGQKVDGLVVSLANPDALRPSIAQAIKAGIPVITINSGAERSVELGAIAHVGQTETIAGQGAGARLAKQGLKHVVCVIHEAGNVGLEMRFAGAKQTFGGNLEALQVNISDLAGATSTMVAKLQSDPSIDGVLTLNDNVAVAAVAAAAQANRADVAIGTFDISPAVLDAIAAGKLAFAIDQQQYLQGYLPIVLLQVYKMTGTMPGGGQPILTGPSFVDKSTVAAVQKRYSR